MIHDEPLSIDIAEGKTADTLIYTLSGPITLRNLFELQSTLRNSPVPPLTILDITKVPYVDSAGIGLIINHHVHCKNKGGRLVAAGVTPRVMGLLQIIKVDTVLEFAASAEAAQTAA